MRIVERTSYRSWYGIHYRAVSPPSGRSTWCFRRRYGNPHNQIFAVAVALGLVGAAVLLAMWAAHFILFRGGEITAWVGTVIVVQNVVSCLANSHLFDFSQGWLYVFGVGIAGGVVLREADRLETARIIAVAAQSNNIAMRRAVLGC